MKIIQNLRRKNNRKKEHLYEAKVHSGTLLIPDIIGFTNFVRKTDMRTGKKITARLLSAIIRSNYLGLKVSEIEGDAILFHTYDKKFSVDEILAQYEIMLESFNQELEILSEELGEQIELTLKLIAHYGKLADYRIGRFHKLYGEPVIEAQRLLKNFVNSDTYVLITNDLLEKKDCEKFSKESATANRFSSIYADLRNICSTFSDYELKGLEKRMAG